MSLAPETLSSRFGYGLPLVPGTPTTTEEMLSALAGPDRARKAWPLPSLADTLPMIQHVAAVKKAERNSKDNKAVKAAVKGLDDLVDRGLLVTLARALDSADPFRERLTAFWANHFCTRSKARTHVTLPLHLIEDVIRPGMTGRFSDLLIAVTTHPAMITYLDQDSSYGPDSRPGKKAGRGLNENLAREVMELHSLGVNAGYTQTDVRQMAELLTGLTFDQRDGGIFDRARVEPGAETVLGTSYDGEGLAPIRAVLSDLGNRPETARHIATKLARHFVADDPPKALVADLTQAFRSTGGDLMAVYRVLLNHPAAAADPGQKIRWPMDYMATAFRALGLTGADLAAWGDGPFRRNVTKTVESMGQPWLKPPGPNGFDEAGAAWINPPYLAARIAWAMRLPRDTLGKTLPEPADFATRALGARASKPLITAASRAESRAEGLGIILASAQMNRR